MIAFKEERSNIFIGQVTLSYMKNDLSCAIQYLISRFMLMLLMLQMMVPAILSVVLLGTRHRLTVSAFYWILIIAIHESFLYYFSTGLFFTNC